MAGFIQGIFWIMSLRGSDSARSNLPRIRRLLRHTALRSVQGRTARNDMETLL